MKSECLSKMLTFPDVQFSDFGEHDILLNQLLDSYEEMFDGLDTDEVSRILSSQYNWMDRKHDQEMIETNYKTFHTGDIVMVEYGTGYMDELSYYHAGLIITKKFNKFLVVPISSAVRYFNRAAIYRQDNLMIVPTGSIIQGNITKYSTFVMDDTKWISPARVYKSIGKISKESDTFQYIKEKALEIMQ